MVRLARPLHSLMLCLVMLFLAVAGAQAQEEEKQEDPLTAALRRLPASVGENRTVTVGPGETWVDIGIREHVGYEHLKRANPHGFATGSILIPGRHQVSGPVTNGLVINLPELMDFRLANGRPVAWYPISIGRITSRWHTPIGELKVINKQKNPSWYRPSWAGGGVMKPGPRNPLGDRWIGLNRPGYGLHGTNDRTSIGRMVSHGCIRHFPQHIHELFDAVSVDTPVIIEYETVTVGEQDGIVYMSVLPDVYGRGTNAPSQVRARLASFDLSGIFTGPELERIIAQADGVARPVLGSHRRVIVNNTLLKSPIGPTVRNGISYLPLSPIMAQVGGTAQWDGPTRTATVTIGDHQASFTADGQQAFTALGATFVPVRALAEQLGGTAEYAPETGIRLTLPEPPI